MLNLRLFFQHINQADARRLLVPAPQVRCYDSVHHLSSLFFPHFRNFSGHQLLFICAPRAEDKSRALCAESRDYRAALRVGRANRGERQTVARSGLRRRIHRFLCDSRYKRIGLRSLLSASMSIRRTVSSTRARFWRRTSSTILFLILRRWKIS